MALTKLSTQMNYLKNSVATSLKQQSKANGVSYGVMAQRTARGTGDIFDARNIRRSNYVPENLTLVNNNFFKGHSSGIQQNSNKMNGFEKAMLGLQVAGQFAKTGLQLAAGIAELNELHNAQKTTSTTKTTQTSTTSSTGSTSSSGNTASLDGMKNAKDSTTLSAAITKAEADAAAIPAKLETSKGELSSLTGQTEGLKSKYEQAQKSYDQNQTDIKDKSSEINQRQNAVDSCKTSLDSAKASFDKLSADYTNAQAKADGCTDPHEKSQLQSLAKQIKTQMQDAEKKVKELEVRLADSQKLLDEANDELNELKEQTEGLKNAAADAKDNYDQNLKDISTKQNEIKDLEQSQKDFEKEIPSQKKRLIELENSEDKELTKINKSISGLGNNIDKLRNSVKTDDADGLSKKDAKNASKADAKQEELNRLKEKQAALEKRQAIRKMQPTVLNGVQFKSGKLPDGTQIYLVNGREVTQEEFNNQKTALSGS